MKASLATLFAAIVMAAAVVPRPAAQTASAEPVSRPIHLPGRGALRGGVSPDGQYYAFASAGSLVLRDLSTGAERSVVARSEEAGLFPDIVWSRGSDRILDRLGDWSGGTLSELRTVRADGTDIRVVAAKNDHGFRLLDWSPDASSVLLHRRVRDAPDVRETLLVSLADGTIRVLLKGNDIPEGAGFTPDGRYVVHDFSDPKTEMTDIHIVGLDGRDDRPLFASPADEKFLGWSPDGGSLLFVRDRTSGSPASPMEGSRRRLDC